jgi:hypothetical protein
MAKDRHDRYPDILAFAYALEDAVAMDLAVDPCAHCGSTASRALAPTGSRDVDDAEAALVATAPQGIPVRRSVARARRRGHASWRRALLIAGAAAAIAIGVEGGAERGGLWTRPERMARACGALSKGASQLLDLARWSRRAIARDVLDPSAAPTAASLLPD